jgi:hypothetical protein
MFVGLGYRSSIVFLGQQNHMLEEDASVDDVMEEEELNSLLS